MTNDKPRHRSARIPSFILLIAATLYGPATAIPNLSPRAVTSARPSTTMDLDIR